MSSSIFVCVSFNYSLDVEMRRISIFASSDILYPSKEFANIIDPRRRMTDGRKMTSVLMSSEEREISRPFNPVSRLLYYQRASLSLNKHGLTGS
jgi:hypothetical protein